MKLLACTEVGPTNNVFRYAQWTPDGSSVITVNEDRGVRLFVIPPNILDDNVLKSLVPYKERFFASPILSLSIHPQFNLQQYNTLYTAISTRDVPVRLYNLSMPNEVKSPLSYGLLWNEQYLPIYATAFAHSGSSLSIGSKKTYALFDINRPGTTPLVQIPTKGIISALTHDPTNNDLSIIGTFDGSVSLIDLRSGSLPTTTSTGSANMQLTWATDGRILQVCRNIPWIDILDARMDLRPVSRLTKFAGQTNQRLHISITDEGRVFGGGTDGDVSIWDAPGDPSSTFSAHEGEY